MNKSEKKESDWQRLHRESEARVLTRRCERCFGTGVDYGGCISLSCNGEQCGDCGGTGLGCFTDKDNVVVELTNE